MSSQPDDLRGGRGADDPRLQKQWLGVGLALLTCALTVGALTDASNDKRPSGPAVTIEPRSAPLGSLLSINGRGLEHLFEGQGAYGRPIYLVRHDPTGDADLVAKLRRGRIRKDGTLREQAWVPTQFETRPSDPATPRAMVPAAPGVYEFAIDKPTNRIPGATFELIPAEVGVRYPRVLYTHCGIETFDFDGSVWLADPPLNDSQGNPPPGWDNPGTAGSFTLTDADRAVFRGSGGQTARFRRAPADAAIKLRPCA